MLLTFSNASVSSGNNKGEAMNAMRSWRFGKRGKGAIIAFTLCLGLAGLGSATQSVRADEGQIRQLMAQQKFERAHDQVVADLAVNPKDGRLRLLYGVVLGNTGQLDEAVAVFKELLADQPGDPQVLNNLAAIYAEQGDFRSAEDMLSRAVLLSPKYAVARSNLGDLYASMARAQYYEALRTDPNNPMLLGKLSSLDQLFGAPPVVPTAAMTAVPPQPPATIAVAPAQPLPRPSGVSASASRGPLSSISTRPVLEPEPQKSVAKPAVGTVPKKSNAKLVNHCFAVGPFLKQASLKSTQIWLQSRMADVREVTRDEQRVVHTVYMPTTGTPEAGRAAREQLRDLGFRDVSVIRSGPLENRVSLGVFRSENSVNRRLAQMAKKGIKGEVSTQNYNSSRSWLRVLPDSAAAVDIHALTRRFSRRDPTQVELESPLCP